MTAPLDLDALERALARHGETISGFPVNAVLSDEAHNLRHRVFNAAPALIAEVRSLRAALGEACEMLAVVEHMPETARRRVVLATIDRWRRLASGQGGT